MGERVLVIDTCGEGAGIALAIGAQVVGVAGLAGRMASTEIVGALRGLLEQVGWSLGDLDGLGVVSGPGSFTGVRTGLATAKGICEGAGLKLVAVSRLAVLERAAGVKSSLAALYAGRGELYVRNQDTGREWLEQVETILQEVRPRQWVVAEERVAEMLRVLEPEMVPLRVTDALPLILEALQVGALDAALVDGNYVRAESEIYKKAGGVAS